MRNWIRETLREYRSLLLFLLLMTIFRSAIADWNDVPTGSMKPTIVEGDRILVNKLAYDLRVPFTHLSMIKRGDPARGEIIIFDSAVSELRLVKRVIGVPGDVISMKDNVLTLNGKTLSYKRADTEKTPPGALDLTEALNGIRYTIRTREGGPASSFGPLIVPPDHYFVLGDNRDSSADSRYIGFVPRHEIVGRSRSVVLSLDYENWYLPRAERFLHTL